MTSISLTSGDVTTGVDTHKDTHHAAVLDQVGHRLREAEFPTIANGYVQLVAWLTGHDVVRPTAFLNSS